LAADEAVEAVAAVAAVGGAMVLAAAPMVLGRKVRLWRRGEIDAGLCMHENVVEAMRDG
jgi:hypothetical protein